MAVNIERKIQAGAIQLEAIAQIQKMLAEIQYGSIEIVIHDGKIAQIERREKIRLKNGV